MSLECAIVIPTAAGWHGVWNARRSAAVFFARRMPKRVEAVVVHEVVIKSDQRLKAEEPIAR